MSRARIVRSHELERVLDVLRDRGVEPAAYTLLPGGAICLHKSAPSVSDLSVAEREAKAWDEALAA